MIIPPAIERALEVITFLELEEFGTVTAHLPCHNATKMVKCTPAARMQLKKGSMQNARLEATDVPRVEVLYVCGCTWHEEPVNRGSHL